MSRWPIRKLLTLPLQAWLTLLELAVIAFGIEMGLRALPLKRLLRLLLRPRAHQAVVPPEEVARRSAVLVPLAHAVFRRYPFNLTCLKQSLILLVLCRRHGLPAELRIGVSKSADTLSAHAWLAQGSDPLGASPEPSQDFPAIFSFGASA